MGPEITIGTEANSQIRIQVSRYTYSDSKDYDDANWLNANVLVNCGAWKGRPFDVSFVTRDFSEFYDALIVLNDNLVGEAPFLTLESQLELKLIGDGRGHILVEGEALSSHTPHCSLSFEFEIDQTNLGQIINQVKELIVKFPEKLSGSRNYK